jgi:ankyrin repeat protein
MAAYNGHSETVRFLLEEGAQVDCRDGEGKTPLIHACTGPFAKTVEILIGAGADVNTKESTEGFTPLMMAAGLGQVEVTKLLLRHQADKMILDLDQDSAIDHARNSGHQEIVDLLQ